jgi:hypothetical protein
VILTREEYLSSGLSVAIVRDGKVVRSKGYGQANMEWAVPATENTVYQIGSLTKQFTALFGDHRHPRLPGWRGGNQKWVEANDDCRRERSRLRHELYDLMMMTLEDPSMLRKRITSVLITFF